MTQETRAKDTAAEVAKMKQLKQAVETGKSIELLQSMRDAFGVKPTLNVKLLNDNAQMPVYATDGAACFDLHASDSTFARPMQSCAVPTGLSFEVPADHVMLVFSRSGHGFKNGVRLANSVGVIDSDYRGEVQVKLHNDGTVPFQVAVGDRIAQALVLPVARFNLVQVDELSSTERGAGGLGSTGK